MSDDYAVDERTAFIGLDAEAKRALKAIQPLILREIGGALSGFYDKVRQTSEVRKFFRDDAQIDGAERRQASHWGVISNAEFSDEYVRGVRKVGEVHARIGLEPRWYIGGYGLICEHLIRAVIQDKWPKSMIRRGDGGVEMGHAVASLVKAVLLDMDFAISIYLDELEAARREEARVREVNEAAQAKVVASLGQALAALAQGDLGSRLPDDFAEQFAGLRTDYNAAVAALDEAMGQVAHAAGAIKSGADEIGVAADDLSRRTEQQAASLEETAAALEQITTTVRRTADGARQASTVVAAAKVSAERSGVIVDEAVSAMGQIESSSQQITQIIGVIDEIAFQTNLLALNAGVEAARAGDAGKGFAVVASEVRALAQRSAEAAKEIKTLISASSQQVASGVSLVDQTGQALRDIVDKVSEIDGLVSSISSSAQEQATGLNEVNLAVNQMDQVTQQNAAMVEQTTAATHALKSQTGDLTDLMRRFSATVDATPARDLRRAPSREVFRRGAAATARKLAPAPENDGWEEF